MKNKNLLLITAIIFVLLIIGIVFMLLPKTISPNFIAVDEVKADDHFISIHGFIAESATFYKGYSVSKKKNGDLVIKIKGNIFAFGNKDSSFELKIDTKDYGDFNTIYLINGDGSITSKIWQKNNS